MNILKNIILDMKHMKKVNMIAPIWQIILRLIVIIPMQLSRIIYCLCILIGWGKNNAIMAWHDTE